MRSSRLNLSAAAAVFLMLAASTARAGVSVQGTAENIRIEAETASLEEVLGALRDRYGLTYTSKVPLEKQVSGIYEGPLSRVVGRLLQDMSFVIAHQGQTLHVVITSPVGRQAAPGAVLPSNTAGKPDPNNPQFPAGFFPPPPPTVAPR